MVNIRSKANLQRQLYLSLRQDSARFVKNVILFNYVDDSLHF